jgi:hypothetical protein
MACGKPCKCPTYRDHLLSVGFAASAMPTRKGAVAHTEAKERVLAHDMAAYKRLRRDGLQPKCIDGSRRLEQGAEHAIEVESGRLLQDMTA